MKLRCYMIIFFLSFSWLLSFQENHLCSDDSSASLLSGAEKADKRPNTLGAEPSSDADHEKEMCHFGHCSHGIGIAIQRLSMPIELDSPFASIPYASKPLNGTTRLSLRPPALV